MAVGTVLCSSGATTVTLVNTLGTTYAFSGNFPLGTSAVSCSATDLRTSPAPNLATVNFLVTVNDVTAPLFDLSSGDPGAPFLPGNPAEATDAAGAIVEYSTPVATDAGGNVSVVCESATGQRSGDRFAIGTTSIYCVATDAAGNETPPTNLFDINVADTTAPVITLSGPAVMNIELKAAFIDPGATTTDAVTTGLTIVRTGVVNTNVSGTYTLTYTATDTAGNIGTATRTVIVADTQAPVVDSSANPSVLLWSPNKTLTPVTISGTVIEASLSSVTFKVVDEYQKIQPTGTVTVAANGTYSFVVRLEAYRNGNDTNGRVYTIIVTARDTSGRTSSSSTIVRVPHNQ